MFKHSLIALFVIATLTRCSGLPVPPDKANYVGRWQSTEMTLVITQGGTVDYKRLAGTTTSVNGPIKAYKGDDFVVGVLFIETTFKVNKPPYQENGHWKMVVDGVKLTKVGDHVAF